MLPTLAPTPRWDHKTNMVDLVRPSQSLDVTRLDALVHYVCVYAEDPTKLGATKLNKTLWYSDVLAFIENGKSITGATYIKHQYGSVPDGIMASRYRLVQAGKIVERDANYFSYPQRQLISLKRPDVSLFSSSEISIVDRIAATICDGHTATSISRLTHDDVWQSAEIGEEIPLYAVLGTEFSEITADDMKWIMEQVPSLL